MAQSDRDLIQKMGIKPRCPLCQAVYAAPHLRLVREFKGRFLFHIFCPHCQASIINITMDNMLGTSSLYMVTDFTQEDLVKFVDSKAVTCDEVIEAYDAISKPQKGNYDYRSHLSGSGK